MWFAPMSALAFPAFPFLATLGPVMMTTHRRCISWWHLDALAIPQVSPCCSLHTSAGQKTTLALYVRGTGEQGLLELGPLPFPSLCWPFLMVLVHFRMADGCVMCKPPPPCTHSICLACPARWLGFGSTRCSCWDRWLGKHLPPEPVN